jgi:hypothetical protein
VPKSILLDEFHVTVRSRHGLGEEMYQAMHRTLNKASVHAELSRALLGVIRRYPSLRETRLKLSR